MNSKFKITIPEPCNENWDKMNPDETGRFCLVCNKSVIDFTNKLPEEIQHYFNNNQNQKICGKFRNSQLNSVNIQIPSEVLYTQTNYYKMFLLALFVVMGTTLFSCADKNGNKKKIDNVEVVTDADYVESNTIGEPVNTEIDTTQTAVPPPPKTDQVKFVNSAVKTKKAKHKKTSKKRL